jgi:hypothetical protein
VLQRTNQWEASLRYTYSLLRHNLSDPFAHLLYCNLFLHGEQAGYRIDSASTVQPGMAVAFREKGDSQLHWVVIEDVEQDLLPDELLPNHPRVERMLGKKPEETFSLSAATLQERTAEVVNVLSKYVYRFQDSLNQFQVRFPDREDLQQVRLAREAGEGDTQLDFAPIFSVLDRRRQQVQQVLRVYRDQPTPVHVLTRAVGRHLFETLDTLTGNPHLGVRWCCLGNVPEREEAVRSWRACRSVVLDLTALYTIRRLGLLDLLRRWQDLHFCVSEATFDKLRDIQTSESQPGTERYTSTDEYGRYVFGEIPEEVRRPHIESLQRLVAFVRECCSIMTTPELANLDHELRDQLVELFDRDGLQSISLAAREGTLLWTDDLTLAVVAHEDFRTSRRVWTQVVLQAGVEEGLLQQTEFDAYSARLIEMGYSFTCCSPAIILQAGSMANWNCEARPLRQVIRQFRLDTVHPQVRVLMAAQSIVGMFKLVPSPFSRQSFILAILNQFASRALAVALAQALDRLFGVDVPSAHEALGTINDWLRGPLRLG